MRYDEAEGQHQQAETSQVEGKCESMLLYVQSFFATV